jgi:hypothetical protein
MKLIIAKMRADWPVVARDRRQCGEWTEADEKEIGAEVAKAIESKDERLICCWARYLADLAAIEIGLRTIITNRPDKASKQGAPA